MKAETLARKIERLLSKKKRKQLAKFDSLVEVLRKLKKKEEALKAKLENEEDESRRKELETTLEVIAIQRKKGVALKKKLEKARDDN